MLTGVSPDGRYLPGIEIANNRTLLFPTAGGAGEPLPGILPGERIANWTADGAAVFAFQAGQDNPFPVKIYRIDRKSGRREFLREISPGDQAGTSLGAVRITPDGKAYAYTVDQGLAVLHVVEGYK
jgi:hypothetical protein